MRTFGVCTGKHETPRVPIAYRKEHAAMSPLYASHLPSLKWLRQGKVRDIYEVDAEHLLIVATDRL